ncbi:unnamed protein product [Alternaria alternata]
MAKSDDILLKGEPFEDASPAPSRDASAYNPLHDFVLPPGTERHYSQQFADMYFLRLQQLKKTVKQRAEDAWHDFELVMQDGMILTLGKLGGQTASFVERVLDVRQGELCWVVGTVYMEMAEKPNVLNDIEKDHWIADPPQRDTYVSSTGADEMMLEDESGRLRVTGEPLRQHFVTGCILAALGTEEADGTFMVIATQCADLPRQPPRWERDDVVLSKEKKKAPKRERAGKLAIVSGLELTGADDDEVSLDLLVEYLTGEAADPATQAESSKITRLVIAGGSLAKGSPILSREDFAAKKSAARHYGYDASSYNAAPTTRLDEFLCEILPSLPITMLPVTNPWLGDIDGYRVLGTGGQTVKDLLKYVNRVKSIDAMEMMLRWRCVAPTAPDTLWCYPFQDDDPLMLKECPHMYIAGCQKKFEKKVIEGPAGQKVLLISVPKFRTSGKIVLVDMESWDVEVVRLGAKGEKATKQRIVVSGEDMMEE